MFSKQTKIFIAGFCSAFCIISLFLVVQPRIASGADDDNNAILQELKALKEELAGFRKDFNDLIEFTGIRREARARQSPPSDPEGLRIINELRNMKAATMMFYADYMDEIKKGTIAIDVTQLKPYVDNPNDYDSGEYIFTAVSDKWWVGFKLAGKPVSAKEHLKSRASSAKLFGDTDESKFYSGEDIVWMVAR